MFSFSLAFGVVELYVRYYNPQEVTPIRFVFDPQRGDIPTPNQRGRKIRPGVFDHTYSNNSLGLRGSKEYTYKRQTEHRILFLGDSFTYGFGVNDDQTFPYLTEKRLLKDHLSVEVMNSGCSGKGTDYELNFFQVLGKKFSPDLVVLCFGANDFIDNERGEYFRISQDGEIARKPLNNNKGTIKTILYNLHGYNWLVSWSQAANLVKDAAIKWFFRHFDPKAIKTGGLVVSYPEYFQGYNNQENAKSTEIYVRNLIQSVKEAGGSLMICYIPMSIEVEGYRKNGNIDQDETVIKNIAQKYDEAFYSLTPVFAASPESLRKLYFIPADGHWTAAGHALAAQYLSEQIWNQWQHK